MSLLLGEFVSASADGVGLEFGVNTKDEGSACEKFH